MPYNVIDATYIAKYKINSNTEIEVFYKDVNFVSVSEVYKVQYNSNGIIRQLIGNDTKYKYNSIDVLKDGIIVDISEDDDDESDDDDDINDDDINDDNDEDKLINMPSSFVIWKENFKIPLMDCYIKWDALSYEKRREFYTTYKAELNIQT